MSSGWVVAAYLVIYGMIALYSASLVLRTRRARLAIKRERGEV